MFIVARRARERTAPLRGKETGIGGGSRDRGQTVPSEAHARGFARGRQPYPCRSSSANRSPTAMVNPDSTAPPSSMSPAPSIVGPAGAV